jgi:hypothetical protein
VAQLDKADDACAEADGEVNTPTPLNKLRTCKVVVPPLTLPADRVTKGDTPLGTRPRTANPQGASRAYPHLSSLHVMTRAQRTRVHFCPQHRLLCHLGLYKFEFEFKG